MKTYQSPTKDKKTKKNFFMRNIYGFIFGITLLVVAGVITLTLVLNAKKTPVVNKPDDVGVSAPPPAVVYSTPLLDFTVGKEASLDKLVYSSTLNQWRTHNGVDLMAAAGADVKCIAAGRVEKVKETTLEGFVVTVSHDDGIVSVYKGLSDVSVSEGDSLLSGTVIGKVAENMMTEQNDGAHLHFEMTKNGKLVDPAAYLPELVADK